MAMVRVALCQQHYHTARPTGGHAVWTNSSTTTLAHPTCQPKIWPAKDKQTRPQGWVLLTLPKCLWTAFVLPWSSPNSKVNLSSLPSHSPAPWDGSNHHPPSVSCQKQYVTLPTKKPFVPTTSLHLTNLMKKLLPKTTMRCPGIHGQGPPMKLKPMLGF
jgi:hypothetical protein